LDVRSVAATNEHSCPVSTPINCAMSAAFLSKGGLPSLGRVEDGILRCEVLILGAGHRLNRGGKALVGLLRLGWLMEIFLRGCAVFRASGRYPIPGPRTVYCYQSRRPLTRSSNNSDEVVVGLYVPTEVS
jgi:hypothetical protein